MMQQNKQRRRTRRAALDVAAAAAFLVVVGLSFSASGVVAAAADETASSSSSALPLALSLGPVFVAEEAADHDRRVEVSEEELILESGALESLMQMSDEEASIGDAATSADADALLQAAVEGAEAAAAAAAPVCNSVESCLALCPTTNFLVAGGATEGSVEESVSLFEEERRGEGRNRFARC